MRTIKAGMLGIGNVGTGTYKTLQMNRKHIQDTAGVDIGKILHSLLVGILAFQRNGANVQVGPGAGFAEDLGSRFVDLAHNAACA